MAHPLSGLQQLDHQARAVGFAVTLVQPGPDGIVGRWPATLGAPACKRTAAGERAGLVRQGFEIVFELENLLPSFVAALVSRDTRAVVPDFDMRGQNADARPGSDRKRSRVNVGAHAHAAFAVDVRKALLR